MAHVLGVDNREADERSRKSDLEGEWMSNPLVLILRLNAQLQDYISWKNDPECEFCDAFLVDWSDFPPVYLSFPSFQLNRRMPPENGKGLRRRVDH